jgi:hypothetical protein
LNPKRFLFLALLDKLTKSLPPLEAMDAFDLFEEAFVLDLESDVVVHTGILLPKLCGDNSVAKNLSELFENARKQWGRKGEIIG